MRPVPYESVNLADVRALLAARANRTSLREVGEEIDINHSTLHNFLHGSAPHPRIRVKLCEWYISQTEAAPEAAIGLHLLTGYLPESRRVGARLRMLEMMAREFAESGLPVPAWLAEMLGEG